MDQPSDSGIPLVGAGAHDTVSRLEGMFGEVRAGSASRLVVLSGPPGRGKTRAVQELYARLAAAAPTPRYWPLTLGDDVGVLGGRKRLVPHRFPYRPAAKVPWVWFGISCQVDGNGRPLPALALGTENALAVNEPLVGRSRLRGRARGLMAGAALALIGFVCAVLGLFGDRFDGVLSASPLLALALALAARDLISIARRSGEHWAASRKVRDRYWADVEVVAEMGASLRQYERGADELIQEVRRSGIAMILVVDDAHHADEATIDFLRSLLERDVRVFVVATAWPDELAEQRRSGQGIGGLLRDLVARAEEIPVEAVPDAALAQLVLVDAPGTDDRATTMLVKHARGNPLILRATLELSVIRRCRDAAGRFDHQRLQQELKGVPSTVEGVFNAYWKELSEALQQLLGLAAQQGPAVMRAALAEMFRRAIGATPEVSLAEARKDHGWLRELNEHLDGFADAGLYDSARRLHGEVLDHVQLTEAWRAFVGFVVQERAGNRWESYLPEVKRVLLEGHLRGVRWDATLDRRAAAASALELVSTIAHHDPANARLTVLGEALGWLEGSDPLFAELQVETARVHLELGDAESGRALLDAAVAQRSGGIPWEWLLLEAELRATGGDVAGALLDLDALLARVQSDGGVADDVASVRRRMAHWMERQGRVDEALALYDLLVAEERVRRAPHDAVLLGLEQARTATLARTGAVNAAVEALSSLAARLADQLGADHPSVLSCRHDHAAALARSGRLDQAVEGFRELVSDQSALLGPEHPATLRSKDYLGYWTMRAGRHGEALTILREVVEAQQRTLGPSHPDTLVARNSVAVTLMEAGSLDEAAAALQPLYEEQRRVLGDAHQQTLITLSNIGATTAKLGRHEEGLAILRDALERRRQAFGAEHAQTLMSEYQVAYWTVRAGGPGADLTPLREVLALQERVLGPDHHETSITRRALRDLGDVT